MIKFLILSALILPSTLLAADPNVKIDDLAKTIEDQVVHEKINFGNNDNSLLKRGLTKILLPVGYQELGAQETIPVVILLHGYSGTGWTQSAYLKVAERLLYRKFILVLPEGKLEPRILRDGANKKNNFWNANGFCCDLRTAQEKKNHPVDDVKYVTQVSEYVIKNYKVDKKRVYLYGHSNGAMMAHRMACERSDLFAAIASLAGGTVGEREKCEPTSPISVLQIHGTEDDLIGYYGSEIDDLGFFPGGWETAVRWGELNSCSPLMKRGRDMDLNFSLPEKETQVFNWQGCSGSSAVSLWKMNGGGHIPTINHSFTGHVLDWLFSKKKDYK